jgi:hypothetical protein
LLTNSYGGTLSTAGGKEFTLRDELNFVLSKVFQTYRKLREGGGIPSPQLAIVGWEDNNFLANIVTSSRVNSSIH